MTNCSQDEIDQVKADGDLEKEKFSLSSKAISDAAQSLSIPLKQHGDTLPPVNTGTVVDPQLSKIRSFVIQLQYDIFSYKEVWLQRDAAHTN